MMLGTIAEQKPVNCEAKVSKENKFLKLNSSQNCVNCEENLT